MALNKSKEYDGNVVFLVDSRVRENDFVLLGRKTAQPRSFLVGKDDIPIPFDAQLYVHQYRKNPRHSQYAKKYVPNSRLRSILLDGRLKASLLINSYGGQGIREIFEYITKHIRHNDGDTDALVSTRAKSAAAMIAETADHRFALFDSDFMWHSPVYPRPETQKTKRRITRDTLGILPFFETHAKPSTIDAIRDAFGAAILNRLNPYNDTEFSGEQLREYGIVDRTYMTVLELRKLFVRRTGIDLHPEQSLQNPLTRFFHLSDIEKQCNDALGKDLKIEFDPQQHCAYCEYFPHQIPFSSGQSSVRRHIQAILGVPVRMKQYR